MVQSSREVFMENYFASQRHNIFRNVAVLIYVFDVESPDLERDYYYYRSCLSSIKEVCATLIPPNSNSRTQLISCSSYRTRAMLKCFV